MKFFRIFFIALVSNLYNSCWKTFENPSEITLEFPLGFLQECPQVYFFQKLSINSSKQRFLHHVDSSTTSASVRLGVRFVCLKMTLKPKEGYGILSGFFFFQNYFQRSSRSFSSRVPQGILEVFLQMFKNFFYESPEVYVGFFFFRNTFRKISEIPSEKLCMIFWKFIWGFL